MPRPDATAELTTALEERILMLDGAMGTTIRGYGLTEEDARGAEEREEDEEESVGVVADDISNPSGEVYNNTAPSMPFSVKKILRDGLIYAGFTDERIDRCGEKRNIDRLILK